MSKIIKLEQKIIEGIESIDVDALRENSRFIGYFYERIVPMINEVISASSTAESYEEGYRMIVKNLRLVHEKVASEKNRADSLLMTSLGQKKAYETILEDVQEIALEVKKETQKQKVSDIAEMIQSGTLDPEAPRKIGQRPEKIKDIRAAKETLFGSPPKSNESIED